MQRRVTLACTLALSACASVGIRDHAMHARPNGAGATYVPGEGLRLDALPAASGSTVMDVRDGDVIRLDPTMVRRSIAGKDVLQYAYNGQIPGPTIRVRQGSTFTVDVTNRIDQPTTVHWHGIRVENRFDGAPGLTQDAIEPGGSFRYEVTAKDDGVFWYHPHVREDVQLDLGLFGNVLVLPADAPEPTAPPIMLALDDVLLADDGSLLPYGKDGENYSMMGRFGNVHLVNGAPNARVAVPAGMQRLYVTNAANARTYRFSIDGARMTLVGGDVGFGEATEVSEVILGPAERAIVDVAFPGSGEYALLHRSSDTTETLATLVAGDAGTAPDGAAPPDDLPADLETHRAREPDHTLRISMAGGHRHGNVGPDGIEWEDSMPAMNAMSHDGNTEWRLVDDETGDVNMDIRWTFRKGDLVKIRVTNDFESMQHPMHFHGQRFLVLASNEWPVDDRQWKDTYLLRNGETVDLLLEASNPGAWMFHCHIAEHLQNGMMGRFDVVE